MPRIAEAARIFYNWIIDLADAFQIEMRAASRPNHPSIDRKETHMAQDLQKPDHKSANDPTKRSNLSAPTSRDGRDSKRDRRSQIDRLLTLEHPDPHSILGPHGAGSKTTVRAYRPDADAIVLLLDDGARVPMTRVHDDGVFEGTV